MDRMNGLSCGVEVLTSFDVWCRKHDNMFSRFDTVPACDGRTDVQPISITCFSIADARKNVLKYCNALIFNLCCVYVILIL